MRAVSVFLVEVLYQLKGSEFATLSCQDVQASLKSVDSGLDRGASLYSTVSTGGKVNVQDVQAKETKVEGMSRRENETTNQSSCRQRDRQDGSVRERTRGEKDHLTDSADTPEIKVNEDQKYIDPEQNERAGTDNSTPADKQVDSKEALHAVLQLLNITDYVCQVNYLKTGEAARFTCGKTRTEEVLNALSSYGIGSFRSGTKVTVYPGTIHLFGSSNERRNGTINKQGTELQKERTAFQAFKDTIKSRLTVHQVVEEVKVKAQVSFDYASYCVVSGVVAALGLGEGNEKVIVAAILLSQLMGAITAVTFGLEIRSWGLVRKGLKTEILGILICISMGLLVGAFYAIFFMHGVGIVRTTSYPTDMMISRTQPLSLISGTGVAVMSGVGVALSVLNGGINSLIGAAISASLLTPAVNAGMLWSLSLVSAVYGPQYKQDAVSQVVNYTEYMNTTNGSAIAVQRMREDIKVTTLFNAEGCPVLLHNKFSLSPPYCDLTTQAAVMGATSLALTVLNIICIILAGLILLKIKEFLPRTNATNELQKFWEHDIKVAREGYKAADVDDALSLKEQLINQLGDLQGFRVRDDYRDHATVEDEVDEIIEETAHDQVYLTIRAGGGLAPMLSRLMSVPSDGGDYVQTTIGTSLPGRYLRTVHARPRTASSPQKQPHRHVSRNNPSPPTWEDALEMTSIKHPPSSAARHTHKPKLSRLLSPFSQGTKHRSTSATAQLEPHDEARGTSETPPTNRFSVTKVPESELTNSSQSLRREKTFTRRKAPEQETLLPGAGTDSFA